MATRLLTGEGGLPRLVIEAAGAVAHVHLLGACVTRYAVGGREVLFCSPRSPFERGRAIRGGVPICWPWFGPHPADETLPQHGLARRMLWEVEQMGEERVVLTLSDNQETRQVFPRSFRLRYVVSLGGDGLTMALETTNTDPIAFTYGEALHTYLAVPDVRDVRVGGVAGLRYIDKAAGGVVRTESAEPVRLGGETDRIYLDAYGPHDVGWDGGRPGAVRVHKSNSANTVLWNPWETKGESMSELAGGHWTKFVCVETVNTAEHAVTLASGQSHTTVCRLEVIG